MSFVSSVVQMALMRLQQVESLFFARLPVVVMGVPPHDHDVAPVIRVVTAVIRIIVGAVLQNRRGVDDNDPRATVPIPASAVPAVTAMPIPSVSAAMPSTAMPPSVTVCHRGRGQGQTQKPYGA